MMKNIHAALLPFVVGTLCSCNSLDVPLQCQAEHVVGYRINQDRIDEGLHHRAAEYYTQLKFGREQQVINLVVDTGSANLVVQGNQALCPSCDASNDAYTPGSSATSDGEAIALSYGSGSGSARKYQDDVSLQCGPAIQKRFGVLTESKGLGNVLGLAYAPLEQETKSKDLLPFFRQLVDNNKVPNIFSMVLCGHDQGSNIVLGGTDGRVKDSDITLYTPIIDQSYYVVDARSLSWSTGESIGEFGGASDGTKVFLDSGTTMLALPPAMVQSIVTKLKAIATQNSVAIDPGFWITTPPKGDMPTRDFSAEELAKFPTLKLVLSDKEGNELAPLNISPDTYFKDWNKPLNKAFAFREASDKRVVLGQPLFENYYIVFDRAGVRIGFYPSDALCKAAAN